MIETKRILKPTGVAFHVIGLMDHYAKPGNGLSNVNFLKYPEPLWSFFVKNNISYHNRLREKQFIDIFQRFGATIRRVEHRIDVADLDALQHLKVDRMFAGMNPEELAVHHSEVTLSF